MFSNIYSPEFCFKIVSIYLRVEISLLFQSGAFSSGVWVPAGLHWQDACPPSGPRRSGLRRGDRCSDSRPSAVLLSGHNPVVSVEPLTGSALHQLQTANVCSELGTSGGNFIAVTKFIDKYIFLPRLFESLHISNTDSLAVFVLSVLFNKHLLMSLL